MKTFLPAFFAPLLLSLPSFAAASIPAADGTFTGCITKDFNYRVIRLIDTDTELCQLYETTVTWSQSGGGQAGESVVATPIDIGDPICPQGGSKFTVQGVDTFACNGMPGVAGPAGPQGPQGDTGPQGPQGPVGPMGLTGLTGPQGAQGAQGPIGLTGATGPQGPMGIPGPIGPAGVDGLPGATGATGPQGPAGPKGDLGPAGPQGIQGLTGATGEAGPAGPQGPAGEQGAIGPQGLQGPPGESPVVVQLSSGDQNCPYGGAAIQSSTGIAYVCSAPQGYPALVSAEDVQQIDAWAGLPSNAPWTLCYKATRDNAGFSFGTSAAFAFHSRCDGRGATFFVAKSTQGKRFGGFTSLPWGSTACTSKNDPNAFLFSLTNGVKYGLSSPSSAAVAVTDCPTSGIVFGNNSDFATNLKDTATLNLGTTYACPVSSLNQCRTDFAGATSPVLVELEVYAAQ
jgi:hypothetical protein